MMIDNTPIWINTDTVTGSETGHVYPPSQFLVVRYLTNIEKADLGRLITEYTNRIGVIGIFDLMTELAFLKFHVKKAPEWWVDDGLAVLDPEPVFEISKKIRESQRPVKQEPTPSASKPEDKK